MARLKKPTKSNLSREERTRYNLKGARQKKGWTLLYASNKLFVSRNYLSGIEDGRRDANDSDFWNVATKVYGVPKNELMKQGV